MIKTKRLIQTSTLLAVSIFATCVLLEVVLRILPIPGTKVSHIAFDEIAGFTYYPGSSSFYVGKNGKRVIRKANKFGYLDKEHLVEKGDFYRVAFFGDSFVESLQVPLEKAFFRIIEEKSNSEIMFPKVETLSFGISSYSTLQSYLTCERWMKELGIDLVVYVFYENDLGDQIKAINSLDMIPYPKLNNGHLSIDDSFAEKYSYKSKEPIRTIKSIRDNSFLLSTVRKRVALLKRQAAGAKTIGNSESRTPNQNDFPSEWPPDLRATATELGAAVLLRWNTSVADAGKRFCILYVPRQDQLGIPTDRQDSWKKWLRDFCLSSDIPFIDPTGRLVQYGKQEVSVYNDHFSLAGHIAISEVFVDWFKNFTTTSRKTNEKL